jgi:predicted transcriptional regulator of viral defense system
MKDMPKGRPRKVTDEELIKAGRDAKGPCFTTREVADETGLEPETIRGRLETLIAKDVLRRKRPGSDSIYWLPNGESQS